MRKIITTSIICLALFGLYLYMCFSLSKAKEDRLNLAQEVRDSIQNSGSNQAIDDSVRNYFVKNGEEGEFVSSIEQACAQLALSCETNSVDETDPAAGSSLQIIHIKMSINGSFDSVMRFLGHFESTKYPIEVTNIQLSSTNSKWQGDFDVSAPVVPE